MKYDHVITRDSKGKIRFPEDISASKEQANNIADYMFRATTKIFGIKQLDETFDEYDQRTGMKGRKGPKKMWTDEEEKYVLLHHEEGDEAVGEALGRSNMSIFMHKSALLSDFENHKHTHEKELVGKSREEIVNHFFGE